MPLLIRSIENYYLKFWQEELATWKKLGFYRKFKPGFYISTSVDILRNTGKHVTKLYIETGRYCRTKLPREERLCKFCSVKPGFHTLVSDAKIVFVAECFVKRSGRSYGRSWKHSCDCFKRSLRRSESIVLIERCSILASRSRDKTELYDRDDLMHLSM